MLSNNIGHEVKPYSTYQLGDVLRLSQQSGWPHRHDDLALTVNHSEGVVVMTHGRVMGTAFASNFGPSATMLNLIMVDEAMRGRGIGQVLMDQILNLSGSREKRLIATQLGIPLYEKFGFVSTGIVYQHLGRLTQVNDPGRATWSRPDDREVIVALDTQSTGMQRESLIDDLFTVGRVAVLRDENSVIGFAALREFGLGEVAGPVVARNTDDAKALLCFVLSTRTGTLMRVDTDTSVGLSPWLEQLGLVCVGQGERMVLDPQTTISASPAIAYALASQALG